MKLREINKKEFLDFCKKNPTDNFFQSKEYAEFARKKGWHTYFLGVDQNGKIKAATLLLSRELKFLKSRVFYAPRGYIVNFKDLELLRFFTKEIKKFIEEKKGVFLRLDPYYPLKQLDQNGAYVPGGFNNEKVLEILKELGYQDNISVPTTPKFLYQLELKGKNNEELLSNCSEEYQKIITENIRRGLIVRETDENMIPIILDTIKTSKCKINFFDDLSLLSDFYHIFKESHMIKMHLVEMDIDLYQENLIKEKDALETNNAMKDSYERIQREMNLIQELQYQYGHKVIMGYNISLYYDNEVTTICTAINNKFIDYHPIYTLTWETIMDAKKNDFSIYNFYGIKNDFTEHNQIYQYNKGFGGNVVELLGEFDLVINDFLYKHYCKYASRHNKKITNFKKKSTD